MKQEKQANEQAFKQALELLASKSQLDKLISLSSLDYRIADLIEAYIAGR
jgi:hypothetical protein